MLELDHYIALLREEEKEASMMCTCAMAWGDPRIARKAVAQLDTAIVETMTIFMGVMTPREAARKIGH